jgi:hypothetical protein
MGKANYQNYDAHIAPVVPGPPSGGSARYIPCKPGEIPRMVVFDGTQCLPRYIAELQPSLPKAPSASPAASALLYAFLGAANSPAKTSGIAAAKKEEKKPAKSAPKTA